MKKAGYYLAAAVLTFVLTAAAYAGQMDTTVAPPDGAPGQMDTTPSGDASGNATIETLVEIAVDIYQSVNP